MNKTYLGEIITGLLIVARSIDHNAVDANGDNIRANLLQGLRDIEGELQLGSEVNWKAQGAIADTVQVDRGTLARLHAAADQLAIAMDHLPEVQHD